MSSASLTVTDIDAEVETATRRLNRLDEQSRSIDWSDAERRALGNEISQVKAHVEQLEILRRHLSFRRAME